MAGGFRRGGGKYHNVGLYDQGQLAASPWQLRELERLERRAFNGDGLTAEKAQDLIDMLRDQRERSKTTLSQMESGFIEAFWHMAIQSADKAGLEWLEAHPDPLFVLNKDGYQVAVHGAIGKAWLTWPTRNTDFYKWLLEQNLHTNRKQLELPYRYADRLEGELQAVCIKAAYDVIKNSSISQGVEMRVMSMCENPRQAA